MVLLIFYWKLKYGFSMFDPIHLDQWSIQRLGAKKNIALPVWATNGCEILYMERISLTKKPNVS